MYSTIRKLGGLIDGPSRVHLALLLIPMFFVALLETVSIGFIIPLMQVMIPGASTDSAVVQRVVEFLPSLPADRVPIILSVVFAGLFILKNVLLLGMTYIINRVVLMKLAAFSSRMFEIYLGSSLMFHLRHNSADILRNLMTGASQSYEAVRLGLLMLLDAILMLSVFSFLLIAEPMITIAIVVVLSGVGSAFYLRSSPIFYRWGTVEMVLEGKLIKLIQESLAGIRDVKMRDSYKFLVDRFDAVARPRMAVLSYANTSILAPRLLIESIVVVGFLTIVWVLAARNSTVNDIAGILGIFAMAALRFMPSLTRIITNAAELKRRTAYIDTLNRDISEGLADSDLTEMKVSGPALEFQQDIELKNLGYRYPGAASHALHDIDIHICKGESIGVVGPSGAGKSTFIYLLLGLLQPNEGQFLIDSRDAHSNIRSWQSLIGFVPQQVHILDDTLTRNIAFGVPDELISNTRIEEVIDQAQLRSVVNELPNGVDEVLGETGARLSGGQRQRIAIARALYSNPEVLIFDEATSALDFETEEEISEAIANLAGNKTIIAISHRLTTVEKCDKLIFLRNGNVVETGTYQHLMAKSPSFRQFVSGAATHQEFANPIGA